MTLSGERAAAVKTYLVEQFGIEANRLRTMGVGPTGVPFLSRTGEIRRRIARR
jgi:outer membrane protein OmpA-like peptidoglycan-associated protein